MVTVHYPPLAIKSILFTTNDCMDAGGRATHGAVAETRRNKTSCSSCLRGDDFLSFYNRTYP